MTKADDVIAYATREIGKPYRYGDEGPNAFDCSGLIQYVFGEAGIRLPRTAAQQQDAVTTIAANAARPGDLVFFNDPATHVALYIGGGRMISAPHTGAQVHITNVYGSPTYGRVSGIGGAAAALVDTAIVSPVSWGIDSVRQVAGDVGLVLVVVGAGASLVGLGIWRAVKGGKK